MRLRTALDFVPKLGLGALYTVTLGKHPRVLKVTKLYLLHLDLIRIVVEGDADEEVVGLDV
jgi:hypothetical protein